MSHSVLRLTPARLASATLLLAGAAIAQEAPPASPPPAQQPAAEPENTAVAALNLPQGPTNFLAPDPNLRRATAKVNGDIITETDISQRVALVVAASDAKIGAEEMGRLRLQVLRNLIDETLQIQAAKAEKIEIKKSDIDRTIDRVAGNVKQTPEQLTAYLETRGASIKSLRRQIEGELAWSRLQRAKIESGVSVGDDEVKAVIDRLNSSKGSEEYRVGEIFLSATPANQSEALSNANRILEQLKSGASFAGYARQFSEASTAAVGGDLGWVRPEQLPGPLAAVLRQMQPGSVSNPIAVPGGVSIIAVQDTRKILTADPRDAVLSLKQVTLSFPAGITRQQAEPIVAQFSQASRSIGGCGGAEKLAADFKGEVVQSDQVKMRDLPSALQQMMVPMQVGQATQPFGSIDEGVRVLVICGRDENSPAEPSFDAISNQMVEERVNLRARRYLRDLRRDAVIEFR